MAGSVFKRCGCTDASGKPLGAQCQQLKRSDHGSWFYKAELPVGPDGSRRTTRRGGFATRREAQESLTDLLGRVHKRTHLEGSRETLAIYLERWLAGKRGLRSTTRRSYESQIRLYLAPGLGHVRLDQLTVEDVEELYGALCTLSTSSTTPMWDRLLAARQPGRVPRPLSDASIRRVHATLMSALNAAAKRRLIPFNPVAFVELASGRRPKAVVWTDERIEQWRRTGTRPKVAVWTPEQT